MTPERRVVIVGLGLMGGSLARALAARDIAVAAHDAAPGVVEGAMREGVVGEALDAELTGVEGHDTVVIAIPVGATLALLRGRREALARAELVMDVASTKRSIVETAASVGLGERFVGAHPLTGSHRAGWGASRASLFEDARVFLTPTRDTHPHALATAVSLWRALRAGVEVVAPAEHDAAMAWRSHLPHVCAVAVANALAAADVPRSALGPGGRDVTRVAGGAPELWTDIVLDNAGPLVAALEAFATHYGAFAAALRARDAARVTALLADAQRWFDGAPDQPPRPRLHES